MKDFAPDAAISEAEFAVLVDTLGADPTRRDELTTLLREDHPVYAQRGSATIARMRGWVLCALARTGLADSALVFVLEELDTGVDPYLVAAAARALRSSAAPAASFAPFVLRAIARVRYHDEPVSFGAYGEYGTSKSATTAVRELLTTLLWLGPHAREVQGEVEALRTGTTALPRKLLPDVDRALAAMRDRGRDTDACCGLPGTLGHTLSWTPESRRNSDSIDAVLFQDHEGGFITFAEFFRRTPSIVLFFYSRCDNPLKCSLTITKLARIQALLNMNGVGHKIRTAAITYDPAFDLPDRLRRYSQNRGVALSADHRMLRTIEGFGTLSRHFRLGVNFVESLVNRHRLEVYVLDSQGRIAECFLRLLWDEREVVARAMRLIDEGSAATATPPIGRHEAAVAPAIGLMASAVVAFFPKCPVCWTAYLSSFGIAGLEQIPYLPWTEPLLGVAMLLNLASIGARGRVQRRLKPFLVALAGAAAIMGARIGAAADSAALLGVTLTVAGSIWSAMTIER